MEDAVKKVDEIVWLAIGVAEKTRGVDQSKVSQLKEKVQEMYIKKNFLEKYVLITMAVPLMFQYINKFTEDVKKELLVDTKEEEEEDFLDVVKRAWSKEASSKGLCTMHLDNFTSVCSPATPLSPEDKEYNSVLLVAFLNQFEDMGGVDLLCILTDIKAEDTYNFWAKMYRKYVTDKFHFSWN